MWVVVGILIGNFFCWCVVVILKDRVVIEVKYCELMEFVVENEGKFGGGFYSVVEGVWLSLEFGSEGVRDLVWVEEVGGGEVGKGLIGMKEIGDGEKGSG